jgi:hypothetical protein
VREPILLGDARAYYDLMSAGERAQVDECLLRLERDPAPDGRTTFAVPGMPDMYVFDNGAWWMVYRVSDAANPTVLVLKHALDLPD